MGGEEVKLVGFGFPLTTEDAQGENVELTLGGNTVAIMRSNHTEITFVTPLFYHNELKLQILVNGLGEEYDLPVEYLPELTFSGIDI